MLLSKKQKDDLTKELVACLSTDQMVKKIVVFGSFIKSDNPVDLDVAVFQESNDGYLPLAMKYRRAVRTITSKIPIDIFPVKQNAGDSQFMAEINSGVTVYEK